MPWSLVLQLLGMALPELIAWTACGAIALARYPRHPTVSLLVASAAGLAIATTIGFSVFRGMLFGGIVDAPNPSLMLGAIELIGTVAHAAAIGMVAAAAFGWRTTAVPTRR